MTSALAHARSRASNPIDVSVSGNVGPMIDVPFVAADSPQQRIEGVRRLMQADPDLSRSLQNAAFVEAIGMLRPVDLIQLIEGVGSGGGSLVNINIYRAWLTRQSQSPDQNVASISAIWFNLGTEYGARGDRADNISCYKTAAAIKPDFYPAVVNLGLAYEGSNQPDLSLKVWRQALQPDDARIALLNNIGRVLEGQKKFKEAKKEYISSLLTDPAQTPVLHHLIGLRALTCDWPTHATNIPGLTREAMVTATRALTLLAMFDDIELQSKGNASWIEEKMPAVPVPLAGRKRSREGKIRIGYLSTDFCMHPISYLIAELIETHDRERFEIHGYCSTKDDKSAVRRRVIDAFDACHFIRDLSDVDAAALIRSHDIDVLIDLNGLTLGTRLQILRSRPAPIQMTYLGYNGPIPLPELDYIIADRFVIPPEAATNYRPRPFYMPRCFQVNDRKVEVQRLSSRLDAGLPEDKFIFCCFSNTYKITEEIFSAWMEILNRALNSVLWIYVDNNDAKENLRAFAASRGIGEDRLLFASRVEPSLYRGRLALADVFLDTYPYNAGTTASDALRVGLPIVTVSGESFISRMAGSLMTAMGVSDGIVSNIGEYIDFSVKLACDPQRYKALRSRLSPELWERTLGDTIGFCKDFEEALEEIVESLA
jgi:predicted O-linked N-acetylglucosamine transferase (SPINDLY family)